MEMGVFYTPRPVVQFIVRAVDEVLKNEFGLLKGLADASKIIKKEKILDPKSKTGKEMTVEKEYHRVQILDVATGTGTFLNEVIMHAYKSFEGQEGRWKSYVESDLLPRLHGFELMMASYTIAHLKLGMTLHDTGATGINKRLGVYLTNTLEEARDTNRQTNIFAQLGLQDAISNESISASEIKKDYPIMCVIGNPPYAISSSNKGEWIQEKLEDYKKGLNEKKINIDDDYIKFIRFAQDMIDKSGEGVVAYISSNSFISGITHRKMRESLLKSFSSIYIVDLHGNARIKEKSPDGTKDQNVFDIMQGVSINIFIKNKKKEKDLADVFHLDLYGDRNGKYDFLNENNLSEIKWNKLSYSEPYYFFIPKDFKEIVSYEKGFKVSDIFIQNNSGIETQKDSVIVNFDKKEAEEVLNFFMSENIEDIKRKFNLTLDKSIKIKNDVVSGEVIVARVFYRPFDVRYCLYSKTPSGVMHRSRYEVMKNYLTGENIGLCFSRIVSSQGLWSDVNISNSIIEKGYMAMRVSNAAPTFPLYLYTDQGEKVSNLNKAIVKNIEKVIGGTTPENILDYVYGYLHDKKYREKYNEFLKIDFPRVPYPSNKAEFDKYVNLGNKLRMLHLMDVKTLENIETKITFPESGSYVLEDKYPKYLNEKVYINDTQYFGNVSKEVWEFYVGGYQPAQKWLKDRRGRKLSNDDIEHYQNIVKVLGETYKIIKTTE
jgi:predicted helicase